MTVSGAKKLSESKVKAGTFVPAHTRCPLVTADGGSSECSSPRAVIPSQTSGQGALSPQ